jgi:tyrosyl-tRNA synthetase
LDGAIAASNILFGNSTSHELQQLSEGDFFAVFEGVPISKIPISEFNQGLSIVDALGNRTGFLASNGEARRELKANAVSVNKEKVSEDLLLNSSHLINGKYILLGKGKKNNYIIVVE